MTPRIAIAVPVGGHHPLLRDCLFSLASQSRPAIVSVLDASGDARAAATIDEFAGRISWRRAGRDAGQAAAILEGWRESPGEILGWLNADDALYPGALEKVSAHFAAHPDTDVLYGHSVIVNDAVETVGYHWAVEEPSEAILAGCIISQPSCFFRRGAYEKAGGLDASLHYTMDWDLWTRLWTSGAKFRFIDEVLSRVLWSREAKTGGFGADRRRELNRIIDAHNPPIRRLKSRIGFTLHHALEYAAPRAVTGAARTLRSGGKVIHGLDRTGRIVGEAALPVAYYGAKAASTLQVAMDVRNGAVRVAAGDSRIELTKTGEAGLPASVAPGTALDIRFHAEPAGSARLISARLA